MKTIHLLTSLITIVILTVTLGGIAPPAEHAIAQISHLEPPEQAVKSKTTNVSSNKEKARKQGSSKPKTTKNACDYIAKYDWDVRLMRAIAMAEGSCRWDAKGDKTLTFKVGKRTYGYSVGALQVRILPGREHCDSFDPAKNIACAYAIYKSQGLHAWTMYSNGGYLRYY